MCSQAAYAQDVTRPDNAEPGQNSVFSDLFAPLGSDFRHVLSQKSLLPLTIGAVAVAASHTWDRQASMYRWPKSADEMFDPGQSVGSTMAQAGGAFGLYAFGRMSHSPRLTQFGASLVRSQIITQSMTQAVKFATQRTRPDGTTLSFPSGHSASMFATATVVEREFGWKAGLPAYVAAAWVAGSRVETRRHYVSDVVAGATVGILAGRAVTFGHGNTRFNVGPSAVPGGIGVTFTKTGQP